MADNLADRLKRTAVGYTAPAFRILASIIAFALGIYGFSIAYGELGTPRSFQDYAYKSLQLVIGQFPKDLDGRSLPSSLLIARWALPLLTAWATIGLAWLELRNPLRQRLVARRGDHLVIAGDESLAGRVIAAERRAGKPVLIWSDDARDRWVADSADLGAPHVLRAPDDDGITDLGLDRARALLIAGPDDAANLALATAARSEVLKSRTAGDPLPLIVRVEDADLRMALEDSFAGAAERRAAQLRFVSLADIVARQLFLAHPLDRMVQEGSRARRLFLIGFSPTAERLATRILAGVHYSGNGKPELVAADPDAAKKRDIFFARRPGASQLAPLTFETAPVDEPALIPALLDRLVEAHGLPNAIIVDPAAAARALPVALAIDGWFKKSERIAPPIFTRAAGGETDLRAMIIPFGQLDTLADPEVLLQERLDTLARAVHDFYFEGRLAEGDQIGSRISMQEWEMLPEAVRDDNRLVADCYQIKLRDIGARLLPGTGDGLRFAPDELEELARAEHDRWMAAKLLDGWVYGEVRDDRAKRHPDIVPYDALSDRIQELDREQIRIMARLVGESDQHAARILIAALDPAGRNIAGGIAGAVEELRARYPDRAILLLGDFADPHARSALIAGLQAGAAVQLVLADNADRILDACLDDRAAARRLLIEADQLIAAPGTGREALEARAHVWITGSDAGARPSPVIRIGG